MLRSRDAKVGVSGNPAGPALPASQLRGHFAPPGGSSEAPEAPERRSCDLEGAILPIRAHSRELRRGGVRRGASGLTSATDC